MRHVERGPQLGQPVLDLLGGLPVPFRGRRYPQREQQFGRRAPIVRAEIAAGENSAAAAVST